jgi:hypothetical protein
MPDAVTAADLWDLLVTGEMVRPADYDSDLVDELRTRLNIADSIEFRQALVDDGFSAEDLIQSLLRVITPVAGMMGDLLSLYEQIAARRTRDENIRFRFNFDAKAEPLDIDLKAFREFERCYHRAISPRTFRRWDQTPAWQMVQVVRGLLPAAVSPRSIASDEWPDPDVRCPESGIRALDGVLASMWELRRGFLSEAMLLWPNRTDYRQGFGSSEDRDPDALSEVWGDESGEVREQLAVMVSDFWDKYMSAAIETVADQARSNPPPEQSISDAADQLGQLVARLKAVHRDAEQEVEDLLALLSLPVWGQRHEVYSAWVFTQIVAAIGVEFLTFHVCDGRLSFDFAGAHLASFDTVNGPVRVWTELRTRYDNPVGKGRTEGIQPDYRLSHDPVQEPATTLLAVECKQYKQSKLRTHAHALIDYTGGLPQAFVVLAAYGPVSPQVPTRLEPAARTRAEVISHLRPGNDIQLRTFYGAVSRSIPEILHPSASSSPPSPTDTESTPERTTTVTLEWQAPIDLDLYAELADGSEAVCYRNQRVTTTDGFIELDRDARTGPGSETITVVTTQQVHIWVHAYRDGTSLYHADAQVRITSGSAEIVIPIDGAGDSNGGDRWFDVCLVQRQRVEVIGRCAAHGL